MERVFITGRGLVTPLGRSLAANEASLRSGRSGIVSVPEWGELNLESRVAGVADSEYVSPLLDRKKLRFCPPAALMSVTAVEEALAEAKIPLDEVRGRRIAVITGVAGSQYREVYENSRAYLDCGRLRSVSPYVVPRTMPSNPVSNLSIVFGFTGECYDVSAACSSSAVATMLAARLIQSGLYDIVIAGGAEPLDWVTALGFNAIRALSTHYNDTPGRASRPFDRDRDGFVLASGAAFMVLESAKSVRGRGVRPIVEISGVGANSNATDMVVPDMASCRDIMDEAVHNAGLRAEDIGYINTHGTATPVGDPVEMRAIQELFGGKAAINSTKSQTGHMIGATGAAEVIFTSIMLDRSFISRSINLDHPEPEFGWADLVREYREGVPLKHALSNSFAFGGANVALVLSRPDARG